MQVHAFRLYPGQDLKLSLSEYVKTQDLSAASLISVVGSLKTCSLRYADKKEYTYLEGPYEIVSLSGTFAKGGAAHLHLCISDAEGKTLGGHLGEGAIIHTTAEIVLLSYPELLFKREPDEETGYLELKISSQRYKSKRT